jgi:cell division protease FtsH
LNKVDQDRVRDVLIQGPEIHGTFANGRSFQSYVPASSDPSLIQRLYSKGVSITFRPQQNDVPWFVSLLVSWLPFIALIGVWIFLSRQMQGAGGWIKRSPDEIEDLKRQIDELQKRLDKLSDKDKT